jgi:single-strand DNA-binding protein
MGYNATITGRVGRDAEIKESASGSKYAKFSLALDNYNSKTGQKGVVWVEATIFGKQAEIKAPYLLKGTPVVLAGELSTWESNSDRDGGSKTIIQMSGESVTLFPAAQNNTRTRAASASDDSDESIPF